MFPHRTWWNKLIDWEDLGEVDSKYDKKSSTWEIHGFCKRKLHVGKEDGQLFKYCPRCLVKITNE